MYRVIKFFTDLQDNNHAYKVGDVFPHDGMKVSEMRLKELSTDANRRHMPLIEKVEVEPAQIEPIEAEMEEPVENRAEVAQEEEPVEGFMNPPEEADETPEEEPVEDSEDKEDAPKPKKKRGRPRNDAE